MRDFVRGFYKENLQKSDKLTFSLIKVELFNGYNGLTSKLTFISCFTPFVNKFYQEIMHKL